MSALDDQRDETEAAVEVALAEAIRLGIIELVGMDDQGRAVYRKVAE